MFVKNYVMLTILLALLAGILFVTSKYSFQFKFVERQSEPQQLSSLKNLWAGVPAKVQRVHNATIFYYKNPQYSKKYGRPLKLLDVYKERFDWPPSENVKLKNDSNLFNDIVFVTAFSGNHFKEMLYLIDSVQHQAPGTTIHVWDMDSTTNYVEKIKGLCGVKYRKLDFSAYPPHVRYLQNYAFKPIIVAEMLREYPRVAWMDASIRFLTTGKLSHTREQLLGTGGILGLVRVDHSIYSATHPTLYEFFPPDMEKITKTEMGGATCLLFYRTETVFKNILLFWVMCALEKDCTEPTRQRGCNGAKLRRRKYADCHRFDQSAMSLLMGNLYNYNFSLYRDRMAKSDKGDFIRVHRAPEAGPPNLVKCS